MDSAQLIQLAIKASILLLVFALGLRATPAEATYLFRQPAKLARAIVAMYVVVPVTAAVLAAAFNFKFPVEIALLAMAVSPVPPILPGKQLKLGGRAEYVYGLLIAMSLLAIVLVPFAVVIVGWLFQREARVGPAEVARIVGLSVLVPVVAGLIVRRFAPGFAVPLASWSERIGTVLLVAGLLPIVFASSPSMWSLIGNGTILAIAAMVSVALAAGHFLAGPDPAERPSLAIASAMRHPGVALMIGQLNFPEETLVPGAIVLFLLVAVFATSLYGATHKPRSASD